MSLLACYKEGQRAPQLQEIRLEIEEEGKKPTYHDFSAQRFFLTEVQWKKKTLNQTL